MAVNKVIINNETIMDLTNDTVTSATLMSGVTAHLADGEQITGTYDPTSILDDTSVSTEKGWSSNKINNTFLPNSALGQANGVASLDVDGYVPAEQLPTGTIIVNGALSVKALALLCYVENAELKINSMEV